MINKKLLLSLSLIATTLVCCTDNEEPGSNSAKGPVILFGSKIVGITQSKAIIEDDSLPDNAQIGIFGWGHHRENKEENTSLRKDLSNVAYTKIHGKDELDTESHAHYPVSPDTLLNFYAYYPYKAEAGTDPLKIAFNLADQKDIMWSTPVKDRDKTTEADKVELSFNHILSAITLRITKADDIKEDMHLQSISLENYPSTLYMNVQTGATTQPSSTNPLLIAEVDNRPVTQGDTLTLTTDHLLCPTSNPVFIIRLSNAEFRVPASKPFVSGKRQTYEFTIQAKDITISGTIKPWEDGGTSNEVIYF